MLCPICLGETRVIDSRPTEDEMCVWRRRRCIECGHRYNTLESIVERKEANEADCE